MGKIMLTGDRAYGKTPCGTLCRFFKAQSRAAEYRRF